MVDGEIGPNPVANGAGIEGSGRGERIIAAGRIESIIEGEGLEHAQAADGQEVGWAGPGSGDILPVEVGARRRYRRGRRWRR